MSEFGKGLMPLACVLTCSWFAWPVMAQSVPAKQATTVGAVAPPTTVHKTSPYSAASVSPHAKDYYQIRWGVDSLSARAVESGLMIRFSYRVVDAAKAKVLNDKMASPLLLDETARVQLVVPSMDKIGQLRQSSDPEVGKMYWMVFSNKEKFVKPGHRISVVIGKFRADGLLVQ
jgi:hypothetical protein